MKRFLSLVVVVVFSCPAVNLHAADRYVARAGQQPSPNYITWGAAASNIQDAVAIAAAGDTVWVSNGVYLLNNQITVGDLKVRSYHNGSLDRDGTIVNGNNYVGKPVTNRCFYMTHSNALVEGFTITNGYKIGHLPPNGQGGGVYIAAGTLRNCLVTGNRVADSAYAGAKGGGVFAMGSNSVIRNCVITRNLASKLTTSEPKGGGVYLLNGAQMWDSRILYNDPPSGVCGVYNQGALLCNCVIVSNGHDTTTAPGGVQLAGDGITRNCLIMGNFGRGAGVYIGASETLSGPARKYGPAVLENCTVVSNTATHGNFAAGINVGMYSTETQTNTIRNTISYFNRNPFSTTRIDVYNGGYGLNAFTNCCLGRTNGLAGSGNFTGNPQFVDLAGHVFQLAVHSPCLNAGTNHPWMRNAVDLDGHPRVDWLSGIVDVGCYEYSYRGSVITIR